MKKIIAIVFMTMFFCTAFSVERNSYRIGMTEWIPWVTLNVAEKKGFWKENGIDVKVVLYSDYFNVSALINDDVDFSIDIIGAWYAQIYTGHDLTILSENDWSNGGDYFVRRPSFDQSDKTIYSYADKIAGLFFINKVLEMEGKSIKDYKVARFDPGYMNIGYKKGAMNMIVSYEPDVFEITDAGGVIVATTADFPGVLPDGIAAKTSRLISIPSKDLIAFFKGVIKAHEWVADPRNKKEMYYIIKNETLKSSGKSLTDAEVAKMLKNVKIHNKKEIVKNNSLGGNLQKYSDEISEFNKSIGNDYYNFYQYVDTSYILQSCK